MKRDLAAMKDIKHYINGQYVGSASGKLFDNVNPAKAALRGPWGKMTLEERTRILHKVDDGVNARSDEFLEAECLDTGKPKSMASHIDIPRGAANFKVFADMIKNVPTESFEMPTPDGTGPLNYAIRRPKGVIGVISPWNLPLLLMTWKVGPALACGNTVVVKPSEETPTTTALLGEVMKEAGVPDGVYNVVQGFGGDSAGAFLTEHPQVDGFTFIGEVIMKAAAKGIRDISLELGGKNAGLVFANFDVEAPELDDWLGDYRWYLDMLLDNEEGGIEFLPGTIKSYVNANWKFGVENFIGDSLHAMWTHDSGAKAMMGGEPFPPADQTGSYHGSANGHGWEFGTDGIADIAILGQPEVIEYYESIRPKMRERLGEMRAKIFGSLASAAMFPNISFLPGLGTFRVWLPRGPRKMELRIWTIVNKNMPDPIKQLINKGTMLTFSPGGTLEMDDGENWEGNTQTNKGVITRQGKLHYGCGSASRIDHPEIPGIVHHGQYNDANQLAFYQRWADLMNADSWEDVPQRHEPRFAGKPTR
jgi:hypothetical protein